MKNAVIYVRVSTMLKQDTERQVRDLTAYAERAGYTVVATFNETASGSKVDRPEREKIMKLARARKIDVVLVTEVSRWSRNTQDLLETVETLWSNKVILASLNGLNCDLSNPGNKLMLTVLGGVAQFEKELLIERTKSGIENARAKGKKIGRQVGQVIRPHPLTKNMLDMRAAGVPIRKIAEHLNVSPNSVQKAINKAKA